MRMFEDRSDPPNNKPPPSSSSDSSSSTEGESSIIWTALSETERWISKTMSPISSLSDGGGSSQNPYSRKKITYVCETNHDLNLIVSGIFRRLKDGRERGESHGGVEEQILSKLGPQHTPRTFRQTEVVVIPSCPALTSSYDKFDKLIKAINDARRDARDYITDSSLDKLDDVLMTGEVSERDWSVTVNCGHMHPKYGKSEQKQPKNSNPTKQEEEEVLDPKVEEYKKKRLEARQSPFPSLVLEVRATPPPDFSEGESASAAPPTPQHISSSSVEEEKGQAVSGADIQKLEALFGRSVALDHEQSWEMKDEEEKEGEDSDDDFYASIGKTKGLDELSILTPSILAQKWIAENDPSYSTVSSSFPVCETRHVDEAYEYVFSNMAIGQMKNPSIEEKLGGGDMTNENRIYLVFPNFLSSSATSFEKFKNHVRAIMVAMSMNHVEISTFHPEDVDSQKRSPVPIFVLQWHSGSVDGTVSP